MQLRGFRCMLVAVVVMVIGGILSLPSSAPRAHSASLQDERGLDLKFPFQPGEEWQITSGTDGENHKKARNFNALDFVPVNGV